MGLVVTVTAAPVLTAMIYLGSDRIDGKFDSKVHVLSQRLILPRGTGM